MKPVKYKIRRSIQTQAWKNIEQVAYRDQIDNIIESQFKLSRLELMLTGQLRACMR